LTKLIIKENKHLFIITIYNSHKKKHTLKVLLKMIEKLN